MIHTSSVSTPRYGSCHDTIAADKPSGHRGQTDSSDPFLPSRYRQLAGYPCLASASAPSPAGPPPPPSVSSGTAVGLQGVRWNRPRPFVLTVISATGTPSAAKAGTPVSLTGQRFTVQIPPSSQTNVSKTSKKLLFLIIPPQLKAGLLSD